MAVARAWVLPAGPESPRGEAPRGELIWAEVPVRAPGDGEVLVEPRVGCWEANMEHALSRRPVDIARQRGEDRIVIGTCGVVRVLAAGSGVRGLAEGQDCLWIPFGEIDEHGYAKTISAYDAPGSPGLLSDRFVTEANRLVPLPDGPYPVQRWAPFARYFTAWDNWRVTSRCWRSQVEDAWPDEQPLVVGWGGGVVFAELDLARREGFKTAMVSGRDTRLAEVAASGAIPIDRREFPDLDYEYAKLAGGEAMERYRASEARYLEIIGELSGGRGAAIFLDNLGGGLYRATLKSLAREGVVSTVGWKDGMKLSSLRATECISRHIHVNTHAWRFADARRIRDVQQETGWLPPVDESDVTAFENVPELAARYAKDSIDGYFPLFSVHG